MALKTAQLVCRHLQQLTTQDSAALPDHELVQRFVLARDDSAFAALVQRHGGMVLSLSRAILRDRHAAEDVFQAAFLVLARQAATIRKGASVGSYLYAVASRLAHKARRRAERQRQCERQAAVRDAAVLDDLSWREVRGILHEEVRRLPEPWRAAIVLCYWQGRTHEEAARHLGCARATVKDRLEQARSRLRTRLARRGLALSTAWSAAALAGEASAATIAPALAEATVRGAAHFAAGASAAGLVSAQALATARGVLQTIWVGRTAVGALIALVLGVLGGAGWATLPQAPADESPRAEAKQPESRPERSEDPLPPGAVARLGTLRFRHGERISDLALGADGTSVVSCAGKHVHVWELATGKERHRFAFDVPVRCVACAPTGTLIAVGCGDGSVHLCEPATECLFRRFEAHKGVAADWQGPSGVVRLQFTADGKQLASAGSDYTIRLWDTAARTQVHAFGPFQSISGLDLSPDGKTLAGIVQENNAWTVRLWQVATGAEPERLPQPGTQPVTLAFAPDGNTLAIAAGEADWKRPCAITLWDLAQRKPIRTLAGHKGWVGWLAFAPDGKTLVSTSTAEVTGRLWDVQTGKLLRPLGPDKRGPQFKVLFRAGGKELVSYGQEHALRFWDPATGDEVRTANEAQSWIGAVSFSPDSRLLASGSADGLIQLWDTARRKEVRRFTHSGWLIGVLFSPDGRLLASAGMFDPVVRLWDTTGLAVREIKTPAMYITCLAWSGDGKTLATWSRQDHHVRLWDAATGKELHRLGPIAEWVNGLAFAPDSRTLAAGVATIEAGTDNKVLLWSVTTGALLRRLPQSVDVRCLVYSPDGRTLAVGGADRNIHLWETASGRKRLTLPHGEDMTALAYSADGKLLAAVNNATSTRVSADGTTPALPERKPGPPLIRLWDVYAAEELPPLPGHQAAITALAFAPNGKLLATASNDTTVLLWDATRLKARAGASKRLSPP